MSKRLFQILDEMNIDDDVKGSASVQVSNHFISADMVKQGTKVSMGAEGSIIMDLLDGKYIPLLVLIDKEALNKKLEEV